VTFAEEDVRGDVRGERERGDSDSDSDSD